MSASPEGPSASSLLVSPDDNASDRAVDITKLIAAVEPFVTQEPDGTVRLDPSSRFVLVPSFVDLAVATLEQSNNIGKSDEPGQIVPDLMIQVPPPHRVPGSHVQSTSPTPTAGGCFPTNLQTFYWWGYTNHYDHCMCQEIAVATTVDAAEIGVLSAFLGTLPPPAGPALGVSAAVLAGYLSVQAAQISAYDTECGDNGVYQSMSWAAPGIFWIKKVC
jgi:hypothetical protein